MDHEVTAPATNVIRTEIGHIIVQLISDWYQIGF
jgi:hypothetical protein